MAKDLSIKDPEFNARIQALIEKRNKEASDFEALKSQDLQRRRVQESSPTQGSIDVIEPNLMGNIKDTLKFAKNFTKRNLASVGEAGLNALSNVGLKTPLIKDSLAEPKKYLKSISEQATQESPELDKPLLNPSEETKQNIANTVSDYVPSSAKDFTKGFVKTGVDIGSSLTSPQMVGDLVSLAIPGYGVAKEASFIPGLAEGAIQGGKNVYEGIKEGDLGKAGGGSAEALFNALALKGVSKGVAKRTGFKGIFKQPEIKQEFIPPEKPIVEPIQADIVPEPLQLEAGKVGRVKPNEYIPPEGSQKAYSEVGVEPFQNKNIIEQIPVEQASVKENLKPYKLYPKAEIGEPFNLSKSKSEILDALESDIKNAKAGSRIFSEIERGQGNAFNVMSDPSTFPIKGLGTKERQLKIINKVKTGMPLTESESGVFSKMYDYIINKQNEIVSLRRQIPLENRMQLGETDFPFGANAPLEKTPAKSPLGKIEKQPTGFQTIVAKKTPIPVEYPKQFSAKPDLVDYQIAKKEASKQAQFEQKFINEQQGQTRFKGIRPEPLEATQAEPIPNEVSTKFKGIKSEPLTEQKTFTTEDVRKVEVPKDEVGAIDFTKDPVTEAKKIAYSIAEKENSARGNVKKDVLGDLKTKLITQINDELYPVSEMLKRAEKGVKFDRTAKPSEKFYAQSGDVYRHKSIADQTLKDTGFINAIQAAPDPVILDQILKAKHGFDLVKNGFETGRDIVADQKIIDTFGKEYKPFTDAIVNHSQKMLDYAVDSGLISKEFADTLKVKYPNYVPFNRIVESIEGSESSQGFTKSKGHLGKQTFIKKMKGSDLPIENSIQNIIKKTYETYQQGEINKTGRELIKAQEVLPELKEIYWEVEPDAKVKNSFDILDNGVKRRFETNSPEIVKSLKGLNVQELNNILKITNFFNRIFKVGTTGLKGSFLVKNPVKDLQSATINLPYGMNVAKSFIGAMYDVAGKGKQFENAVRKGVLSSEFDAYKETPNKTIESIRSKRSGLKRTSYLMSPKNWVEALNEIEQKLAIPEYAARQSVFKEGQKYYEKKGFSKEDATVKAKVDAQKATADFVRRGSFGREIGALFPYIRAGFAGARSKIHYFKESPVAFSTRLAITTLIPTALATIWNLSEDKKAKAYFDIKKHEKENSILVIPSDTSKDEQDRWKAFKMPVSPEFKNEQMLVQKLIERIYTDHPTDYKELTENVLGILSPVTSPRDMVSSLTPVIKSPFEQLVNKDVYRDKQIVPDYLSRRKPEDQSYPWTPASVKKTGGLLGVSPLRIQKTLYDFGGGVGGNDIPNLLDQILSYTGQIKSSEVGGKSIPQTMKDVFYGASGGQIKENQRKKMKGIK